MSDDTANADPYMYNGISHEHAHGHFVLDRPRKMASITNCAGALSLRLRFHQTGSNRSRMCRAHR